MTTINSFFNLGSYETGPTVNKIHTSSCSQEYGTRDWAIDHCNKNRECTHLDDWHCDDMNWRYCLNVTIDDFKDSSETDKSCTLLKKLTGIRYLLKEIR